MIGKALSHYQVLEQLGAGGMGVVYRARDKLLERDVAIKVLPAGALADEGARKQFRREALTLSRLNHPNIETIFELGSEAGIDFLALELVHGRTLAQRIAIGPLPESAIAALAEQLAEGLGAAHKEGILHRDIKPRNLIVTTEGRLKILDFGLAKLTHSGESLSGAMTASMSEQAVGTLPYMAPEQLRGGPIDARCDLYAVGAVLYEMACGRRAFPQEAAPAVIGAILGQPSIPPHEVLPGISTDLERIILRCLEKDPEDRYAGAKELAVDLRQLALPESQRHLATPGRKRRTVPAVVVGMSGIVLLVLAALALNPGGLRDRLFGVKSPGMQSLAVLPLANLSRDPDQEFFADGMTDELITKLSQVGALRVIARSSVMQYRGTRKPVRQIARELDVGAVVEGSVERAGDMVRISAQLVDARSQKNLWAESYQRSLSNVLALQSDVARAIVERVRAQLTPAERTRLASAPVVIPGAHEEYLRGQFELNRYTSDSFLKARDHFLRAMELDPGYAPAHAGLAWSFLDLSSLGLSPHEAMPRAKAAAEAALQLDSTCVQAITALGYVTAFYEWDWERAEANFKRGVRLYPGRAEAHQLYGYYLTVNGSFDEALREFRVAHHLDPLQGYAQAQLLWPLYEGRHYRAAVEEGQRLLRASPNQWNVQMILGQSYAKLGDFPSSIGSFQHAVSLDENTWSLSWLSYGYGVAGQKALAQSTLDRAKHLTQASYTDASSIAVAYVGLGQRDEAFHWLERGVQERAEGMVFIKVDPAYDALRSDPRFPQLLRKVGFGP